jgi:uncharacterized protein YdeI (YjbR/CyaY-like superfamily)
MSKNKMDLFEHYQARNRKEWRHGLKRTVLSLLEYGWSITKETVESQPFHTDNLEEALNFGWIDSKVNALDEERYMPVFTPRKP